MTKFNFKKLYRKPNVAIFSVRPINNQPLYYEIFLLTQPVLGSYEFRPFQDFYRTLGNTIYTVYIFINLINQNNRDLLFNQS